VLLGTPYGTTWGTLRELDENKLRTRWEQGKKAKKKLPQDEKRAHHECMLSLPIGCVKFLYPKLFVTIFNLA